MDTETIEASSNYILRAVKSDKKYDFIITLPSNDAVKTIKEHSSEIVKKLNEIRQNYNQESVNYGEVLMEDYLNGIQHHMNKNGIGYSSFSKVRNIGSWNGFETPRVHIIENGIFDLKDFIMNCHKNEVYKRRDNFNELYQVYADVLKKNNVPPLAITDEWTVDGETLRKFEKFLTQKITQGHCNCGDID